MDFASDRPSEPDDRGGVERYPTDSVAPDGLNLSGEGAQGQMGQEAAGDRELPAVAERRTLGGAAVDGAANATPAALGHSALRHATGPGGTEDRVGNGGEPEPNESEVGGRQEAGADGTEAEAPDAGAGDGHDGPIDRDPPGPADEAGGGDPERPWRRDRETLSPDQRAALEAMERDGVTQRQYDVVTDSFVVAYGTYPGGTGYASGTIRQRPDDPARATAELEMVNITPGLRGFGLSGPLVSEFTDAAVEYGADTVRGDVSTPAELGAVRHVFGDRIAFSVEVPEETEPRLIATTAEEVMEDLSRPLDDTSTQPPEDEQAAEQTSGRQHSTYHFEASVADRRSVREAPEAPRHSREANIDLSDIDSEAGSGIVALEIATAITRGDEVGATLTEIAHEHPERGAEIAAGLQEFVTAEGNRDADIDVDVLLWIRANLSNNPDNQGVELPVDELIGRSLRGSDSEAEDPEAENRKTLHIAAAGWAPYGDKTAYTVNELANDMYAAQQAFVNPGLSGTEVSPFIRRYADHPVGEEELARYSVQPLTADMVITSTVNPNSPRLTTVSNAYSSIISDVPRVQRAASGLYGVQLEYERVPQYMITFDTDNEEEVVTIRDIEPIPTQSGDPAHPQSMPPQLIEGIEMSEFALGYVATFVARNGVFAPTDAALRIISVDNNPLFVDDADRAAARERYDDAARRHGMRQDMDGNWVAPLNLFL